MYKSVITKTVLTDTENFCLFTNALGNKKAAKFIFFEIKQTKAESSTWEIYLNPTVTSNGTLQTVTIVNDHINTPSTVSLYQGPTVSEKGLLIRRFNVPTHTKEFSTNAPIAQLEPGYSILITRSSKLSGNVTSTWTWKEVETSN